MKRDPRLRSLSSEHHNALVLARTLSKCGANWPESEAVALGLRFDLELEPHFRIEEELLLPALRAAGAPELADLTAEDHAFLRETVGRAREGDVSAARAFAARLTEHVRFEERELFPACETLLSNDVLDEVARRSDNGRPSC